MMDALRRPLPLPTLAVGIAILAIAVALYCVAYTWLAGRPETFAEALGWALVNICPWLLAIEAGKRADRWSGAAWALGAGMIGSLALGYLLQVSSNPLAFEAVRRLPALAASAGAIALLRSQLGRKPACREMKLLPRQIEWVRAAGNYVEVRANGRTVVQRASIGALERDLAKHGFVRIHRSMLVRRDRIARVRPQDVVLHDGTLLPVGKRYRAALAA
jgi:hypothetical protein